MHLLRIRDLSLVKGSFATICPAKLGTSGICYSVIIAEMLKALLAGRAATAGRNALWAIFEQCSHVLVQQERCAI